MLRGERACLEWKTYPGEIEFGLDTGHVTFFFILSTEDVELRGAQRSGMIVSGNILGKVLGSA